MQEIIMQPIGYVNACIRYKAKFPAYDRKDAHVPEWVTRLMEHYF